MLSCMCNIIYNIYAYRTTLFYNKQYDQGCNKHLEF